MYEKGSPAPFITDETQLDTLNFEYFDQNATENSKNCAESAEESEEYEECCTNIEIGEGNQPCYICYKNTDFYCQNLYETKAKHSGTRICDFIGKWLGENQSTRTNAINTVDIDANDDHCICVNCFKQINEYDLMCVTAERIDRKLRNVFWSTESICSTEPKTEPNEETPMDYEHNEEAIAIEVDQNNDETIGLNMCDTEDLLSMENPLDTQSDEENSEDSSANEKPVLFKCKKCSVILNR